jgi:hypothetical protein
MVELCEPGLPPHRLDRSRSPESSGWGDRTGQGRRSVVRRLLPSDALLHWHNAAVAPAVDHLNNPLLSPTVANGSACRCRPAGQGGLTDKPAGQLLREGLFLRHDTVALLDEIGQHVEHLRLKLDQLARIAQLLEVYVKFIGLEGVNHRPCPQRPPAGQIRRTPPAPYERFLSRCARSGAHYAAITKCG